MTRHSIVIVLAAVIATGCKGETVVKPDPQTQADLDQCRKDKDEKDKRIAALQDENAQLMREKGSGAEITVALEGNVLTVKPHTGGGGPPIDDKAVAAASKEFVDVVQKSRGAIQKCYEQALKKNTGLQARTVTLTVSASFTNTGAYRDSSFAPSLGDAFDNCIKTVATKWVLPQNSPAMTFKATVSLTPS
jgi:FlaG/FlaF family flagellin (archaellin)